MENNDDTKVEIELDHFSMGTVKIDGVPIRGVRRLAITAEAADITTIAIEVLGKVDATVHGKVHIVEIPEELPYPMGEEDAPSAEA